MGGRATLRLKYSPSGLDTLTVCCVVLRIHEKGHEDLNQEVKRALAGVVTADQVIVGNTSPLFKHMHKLSFAVSELFIGHVASLSFPNLLSELEVEALVREC